MVKAVKGGYVVKSESGKTLSRVYKTRESAEKRLQQIHYFSNKKGK